MISNGIWFGPLADGTQASLLDVVLQEAPVSQAARLKMTNMLNVDDMVKVAQFVRHRYPELNREETPSLYSPVRFARKMLSEDEAAAEVKVQMHASATEESCREDTIALINKYIHRHPYSISRLGWCIDFIYAPAQIDHSEEKKDENGDPPAFIAYLVITISHNHADGVAMKRLMNDFLEGYNALLEGRELPNRKTLPLYSTIPQDRANISWSSSLLYSTLGRAVSYLTDFVGPSLLTEQAAVNAESIRQQRLLTGVGQQSGPFHIDFVEIENPFALRSVARANETTVGALVHASLFVATAQRYFREHPNKSKLSLNVPLSVNMRGSLDLPDTVLTPQQGEIAISFQTTRQDLAEAEKSDDKMALFLIDAAKQSRSQVDKKLPTALDASILLSGIFRQNLAAARKIQYLGDSWLSNVGVYKPVDSRHFEVDATLTFNPTIVPSYELVWCNTVVGGNMTLSIVVDESMGRDRQSALELLNETKDQLLQLRMSKE